MPGKVLLIEDDTAISEMLKSYLSREGLEITAVYDGEAGVAEFFKASFDIVVLDIMMPKLDGMGVMRAIREKSNVPILIMSAKDTDVDKAVGLGLGADDYITKPFSMLEIAARIKAAIRRASQYSKNDKDKEERSVTLHELVIDLNNYSVTKKGEHIKLTSKEFEILKLFVKNPGRVFTKAQVYSLVWDDDYFGDENVINVHMSRLREKIEDDASSPQYIKTLWGIGYKLGEF